MHTTISDQAPITGTHFESNETSRAARRRPTKSLPSGGRLRRRSVARCAAFGTLIVVAGGALLFTAPVASESRLPPSPGPTTATSVGHRTPGELAARQAMMMIGVAEMADAQGLTGLSPMSLRPIHAGHLTQGELAARQAMMMIAVAEMADAHGLTGLSPMSLRPIHACTDSLSDTSDRTSRWGASCTATGGSPCLTGNETGDSAERRLASCDQHRTP
jgi:hypothetical protein